MGVKGRLEVRWPSKAEVIMASTLCYKSWLWEKI